MRYNKRWTTQEDNYLRKNYQTMVIPSLAKQLNRTERATRGRCERLGLALSALGRNGKNGQPKKTQSLKTTLQKLLKNFEKYSHTELKHRLQVDDISLAEDNTQKQKSIEEEELTLGSMMIESGWQNLATSWSNTLVEDWDEQSMSIISMEIKKIIESKTYTYQKMLQAICLATCLLRKSYPNLWKEILSDLTLIQEGTKYARIVKKTKKQFITEGGNAYQYPRATIPLFLSAKRHLGGISGPEVFPLGGTNETTLKELSKNQSQGMRVYSDKGTSTTIAARAGGWGAKTGLYSITRGRSTDPWKKSETAPTVRQSDKADVRAVLTPDRAKKRQNGRRFKTNGEPAFTLTGQDIHGVYNGARIRRLTPVECCRLQAFPDSWCDFGADGEVISDAQKYKMMGNAVTTSVITAIGERLANIN